MQRTPGSAYKSRAIHGVITSGPDVGGLITFVVGASIAIMAIFGWAVLRWRDGRARGGRRW